MGDSHKEGFAPVIDRAEPVSFTFDGQRYTGYAGDTVGSALYRAGVRTLSRSFKYHRPRGLLCVDGSCPNCLVNVDGTPNVRACVTPVEPGMKVRSQNAWPSLSHDLMALFDRLDRFLPVGFYYKTFIRPRALWPLYETVLRHAAGLGRIDPNPDRFRGAAYDQQFRHAEVTVVGGGPAGMSAALAAAELGARVILIDEQPQLGGHLRYRGGDSEAQRARDLPAAVQAHPNVESLTSAGAFGWYEGHLIGVAQADRLLKLRTAQLVVATGRLEQPLVFENNDRPGVMLGRGVQRLMHLYGVRPGRRALVVTQDDDGWAVARDLLAQGVDVALVLDARREVPESASAREVQAAGVAGLPAHTIRAARGKDVVTGAVAVRLDEAGRPVPGTEIELQCDLISLSTGSVPNNALLYQSGCKLRYDPQLDAAVPETFAPGVWGAGEAVATRGLAAILLEGQIAGLGAALSLDRLDDPAARERLADLRERLQALKEQQSARPRARPLTGASMEGRKKFVCLCEDVTAKEVADAIAEGFDDVETLKRYSTVSMGPCQGKMCAMNTIRLCARETGRSVAETGTTTARPPFTPVKLGLLAGRKLEPVRHTPLHERHLALGARMMNAGQWKRPEHYGDPRAAVEAVRQSVGLIDVSTLGKIDLQGPDALAFLERVYTGRFSDLAVGQLRYGLLCTEEGVIFDDGVVGRLGPDHFYLTTSSGGINAVYEWLTWWLATWDMQVHVTDVTAAFAAVNVAGPRARALLRQLTDADLSPQALPYLRFREAALAGVPARLLRLGFVGELSYEVHCPASYGPYLWATLMEAGTAADVTPFGVEAQRVLRLEKGHLIVGQDTDALSDPFGAGLGWAVRLDKADFVGLPSLARRQERGPRERLVGFQMRDPSIVPGEGQQVVERGRFMGRVTSARYSPTLNQAIGLCWLPADRARPGTALQVRVDGAPADATVARIPFYDPEGARSRG